MWHDHSTVLVHGYVMITVIFFTIKEMLGQESFHNIQSFIDEPEIHILAMSSSCAEGQAALVKDRINCIKELTTDLCTPKGIYRLVIILPFSTVTSQPLNLSGGHNREDITLAGLVDALLVDLTIWLTASGDLQEVATAGMYTCNVMYM